MGRSSPRAALRLAAALALLLFAAPAIAKDAEKEALHLRYARSYAEAMAEAKERGCVIFATVHEDG